MGRVSGAGAPGGSSQEGRRGPTCVPSTLSDIAGSCCTTRRLHVRPVSLPPLLSHSSPRRLPFASARCLLACVACPPARAALVLCARPTRRSVRQPARCAAHAVAHPTLACPPRASFPHPPARSSNRLPLARRSSAPAAGSAPPPPAARALAARPSARRLRAAARLGAPGGPGPQPFEMRPSTGLRAGVRG